MKLAAIVETMSHVQKTSLLTAVIINSEEKYSKDELIDFVDDENINLFDIMKNEDFTFLELVLVKHDINSFAELIKFLTEMK
jgi:hypothetical protein